ncbi:MAG: ABC-type dipeptide transport system, periplasmic component [Osedax symbiont Rs2]|nr:MAG: ABC-type dipeptide transport system, periplasmic component [Osedax symbiont Rs2]
MHNKIEQLTQEAKKGRLSRRDFMRHAAAIGLAAPLATSLLGQSAFAAEAPKKGGHLIAALTGGSSTDSLDPALSASNVPFNILRTWGETLVDISPEGEAIPWLAESWESSNGATTWTFTIRKGITFHNGKTMDNNDVAKTLQRHSGEDTKSGALGIMRDIKSITTQGSDKVVVELTGGNADLPYLMSDYHLVIQPNGGFDAPAAGVGTGPYQVKVNEPGIRHVGEKYAGYWRDSVGHADTVEIRVMNDQTARMAALQSGSVHFVNRVAPKTAKLLGRLPNVDIVNAKGRGHYPFLMHADTAPFDNNELRLALKYAIDREDLVKRILKGYGTVGNDNPINAAYDLFNEDIEQRAYDPDKAAFHYKKSGHSGPIVLRSSEAAFSGAVDAALLFSQHAAKAGIEVKVQKEPADGYWSNVWNKQPFCASYWGGRNTQDQMFSVAYKSTADWNDTKWQRPEFDSLLAKARTETNRDNRKEIYTDMSMMVRDEGGAIIPMFNDFVDAKSDKVGGYISDPSAELSNGFALIRCWLS